MGGLLFIIFVAGPIIGTLGGWVFRALSSVVEGPEPIPDWELPAGLIHFFEGDRRFNSAPYNPFDHSSLNWHDGSIGCAFSWDLDKYPEYKPAQIGTIEIMKPEHEKGTIVAIFDNSKVAELGLIKAGLCPGAQALVM